MGRHDRLEKAQAGLAAPLTSGREAAIVGDLGLRRVVFRVGAGQGIGSRNAIATKSDQSSAAARVA